MNRAWRAFRRVTGALASVAREIDYAQRRSTVLYQAPDRHMPNPNKPPDSFGEFLTRTRGPLLHEPSARARLAGRRVR